MALVLVDLGADVLLKSFLNKVQPAGGNNLTIKLYTNNYTPVDTSATGNFTVATGGGYVDKTLTAGSWTVTPANDPSDAVYTAQVWTFTGPLTTNPTIYGYAVYDADGVVIWAELLPAAFTPANNGDTLSVTPKFQASKGTPT